jgi:predicted O-methyltransferase YrrM
MFNENNTQGGTAHMKIHTALDRYNCYKRYINRHASRTEYQKALTEIENEVLGRLLNENQFKLSTRFPIDEEQFVDTILATLNKAKVINDINYPKKDFVDFRKDVKKNFQHENNITYIFPEEERLLFALSHIVKPKHMVFLGSYYGYWSIWAMPALQHYSGKATLIDVNPAVLTLAEKNCKKFSYHSLCTFMADDAIKFFNQTPITHDFAVLDAEGPKFGTDPDLLDKAIYFPIIRATYNALAIGGLLLCHNILLRNAFEDTYFDTMIANNQQQFSKFLTFIQENFSYTSDFESTEGIGVYRK